MLKLKSKSDNSSMGPGGSITRIKSSRNILRQNFGIRFGRLNILGVSRGLSLNNGFIRLLLLRRKFFRHRGHEQHEIGFFEGISTYGEGDNHRFWCILAIRCTLDLVPNAQKTLAPFKT